MSHLLAGARAHRGVACLGAALLLVSCSDDASMVAPTAPPPNLITMDGTRGMQIDASDTWLAVDIEMQSVSTVTTATAFPDPQTGQPVKSFTVASPREDLTLAGGYDAAGQFQGSLVASLDPDPNADPADQIRETRFSGDAVVNYNVHGQVMGNTLSDGTPIPSVVSEDLFYTEGEMLDGVVIEDPVVFSGTDPYGGGGGVDHEPAPMWSVAAAGGGRRRVERPADGTVVVTDELDESLITGEPAASGAAFSGGGRASGAVAPGSSKTRVARTFRKREKVYLLESIRMEREDATAEGRARHVQTMRYRNVRWNRNQAKDGARIERRNARAEAAARTQGGPRSVVMLDDCTRQDAYTVDSPCAGDPYPPPPPPAPTPAPVMEFGSPANGGPYVVFQHGFAQNRSYYANSPAFSTIRGGLALAGAKVTGTDYGALFQDQARELESQMPARRSIIVGHSNGGIVARQLARSRPDLVDGIVTVSSPHHGVPLLRVEGSLAGILSPFVFVVNTVGCKWFGSRRVCGVFDHGAEAIFARVIGSDGRPVPVFGQERWDHPILGPYLNELNDPSRNPEQFTRMGIEQHTRQRWLLWRTIEDRRVGQCPETCGRRLVADLDKFYGGLRAATVVRWTWNPFKLAGRVARAAVAGTVIVAINAVDGTFASFLGAGHKSDGLVPFRSQRYPNASAPPIVVPFADSHNTSAYSGPAVNALRSTLLLHFRIPEQR